MQFVRQSGREFVVPPSGGIIPAEAGTTNNKNGGPDQLIRAAAGS